MAILATIKILPALRRLFQYLTFALAAAALLASCSKREPVDPIKPVAKRTVLFLTGVGAIYDLNHELVIELPHCTYANQIIADGADYFVSGFHDQEKVGYWKNGKWNTLHVDFIEDVDHTINGMAKWEYYIYLLDHPNVLKNSGIYRLEDGERFLSAPQALAVTDGKCFVVGSKRTDDSGGNYLPVVYTEQHGVYIPELLPLPDGAVAGDCTCVYAGGTDHCVIGGYADGWPVIWVDKVLQMLPLSYPPEAKEPYEMLGEVSSITECNGIIYAAGNEPTPTMRSVATVWSEGKIRHLVYSPSEATDSEVLEIKSYGSDVYVLTLEYSTDSATGDFVTTTVLWMNNAVVKAYRGFTAASFAVL